MTSRAERDRANVAESLRRHGFGAAGIESVFAAEAEFVRRERAAKRAKPVEPTALDFGDWE